MILKLILLISLIFPGNREDNLKNEIEKYLSARLSQYESFEFEIISSPKYGSNRKVLIDNNREFKRSGDFIYLPVVITTKNSTTQATITLKVKLFAEVLTANNSISKGSRIIQSKVKLVNSDIAGVRGKFITDTTEIENMMARLDIDQGEIILKEKLEKIPLIKRGDQVTAIVISGNVVVTLDATAREYGCEGDVINITTSDKKQFKAQVLDNSSVKILE